MKKLLFLALLVILIPNMVKGQSEFGYLQIQLELPISLSDSITSISKIEKKPGYVLTYYLSPYYKEEDSKKPLDSTKKNTKFQVKYLNKAGRLCDLLDNCRDGFYSNNQTIDILEINPSYRKEEKGYDVLIVPDKATSLEDIQDLTTAILESENIENIYFAFKNSADKIKYFHFAPEENFNIFTQEFRNYKDWVEGNFKIVYGEVIFFVD